MINFGEEKEEDIAYDNLRFDTLESNDTLNSNGINDQRVSGNTRILSQSTIIIDRDDEDRPSQIRRTNSMGSIPRASNSQSIQSNHRSNPSIHQNDQLLRQCEAMAQQLSEVMASIRNDTNPRPRTRAPSIDIKKMKPVEYVICHCRTRFGSMSFLLHP